MESGLTTSQWTSSSTRSIPYHRDHVAHLRRRLPAELLVHPPPRHGGVEQHPRVSLVASPLHGLLHYQGGETLASVGRLCVEGHEVGNLAASEVYAGRSLPKPDCAAGHDLPVFGLGEVAGQTPS